MKKTAKDVLRRAGLLAPSLRLYHNLRALNADVLRRHVRYARCGAPDALPLPPPGLVFDVIGCRWTPVFYDSGALVVADMAAQLERSGHPLQGFEAILDFGCGCGRLIRHVHARTEAALYGTDYNPRLVAWCEAHLPFGTFRTNDLRPPLSFDDDAFDFVYARSVFTHLTEDLQRAWMAELRRVLRPGGVLYLTTHGERLTAGLSADQKSAFGRGELVVTFAEVEGENLCSVYASRAFVESRLAQGFRLLDFVPGRDRTHLRQDVYLLQKA